MNVIAIYSAFEGVNYMNLVEIAQAIKSGQVSLGIELGSTRIKAVLAKWAVRPTGRGACTRACPMVR